MKASASDLINKSVSQNMLSRVRLEYNVDWIKGPRETHLSLAESKAYVLISAPSDMKIGSYIFGEISFVDVDTGLSLAKIPVTLVRSFKANKNKAKFNWQPTVASDSGERAFIGNKQ